MVVVPLMMAPPALLNSALVGIGSVNRKWCGTQDDYTVRLGYLRFEFIYCSFSGLHIHRYFSDSGRFIREGMCEYGLIMTKSSA